MCVRAIEPFGGKKFNVQLSCSNVMGDGDVLEGNQTHNVINLKLIPFAVAFDICTTLQIARRG